MFNSTMLRNRLYAQQHSRLLQIPGPERDIARLYDVYQDGPIVVEPCVLAITMVALPEFEALDTLALSALIDDVSLTAERTLTSFRFHVKRCLSSLYCLSLTFRFARSDGTVIPWDDEDGTTIESYITSDPPEVYLKIYPVGLEEYP